MKVLMMKGHYEEKNMNFINTDAVTEGVLH